jgi:chromate transporter
MDRLASRRSRCGSVLARLTLASGLVSVYVPQPEKLDTMLDHQPTASGRAIFAAFLQLGLTAFGGPATVAYIRDLAVKRKGWLTADSFQDGVALCQSIPGATAMQAAAYVGLRAGGPLGALAAYVGFGLPAFVLMLLLTVAYQQSRDLPTVTAAFRGLQVVVVAVVANAALSFGRHSFESWRDIVPALGAAAFLLYGGSPIIVVCAAAALGLPLYQGLGTPPAGSVGPKRTSHWSKLRPAVALLTSMAVGLLVLFCFERRLFDLSTLMLKVDLFAFGGGFASVPLMLHEVVGVRHWMDSRTFMDGIALGQVTPGPIVITATFVGYQLAGLPGAVAGTVSVFTPSMITLMAAVPYFDQLQNSPMVRRALRGVLASFVGLLLAVALRFGLAVSWNLLSGTIAVLAFSALRLGVDILWVALVVGVASLLLL